MSWHVDKHSSVRAYSTSHYEFYRSSNISSRYSHAEVKYANRPSLMHPAKQLDVGPRGGGVVTGAAWHYPVVVCYAYHLPGLNGPECRFGISAATSTIYGNIWATGRPKASPWLSCHAAFRPERDRKPTLLGRIVYGPFYTPLPSTACSGALEEARLSSTYRVPPCSCHLLRIAPLQQSFGVRALLDAAGG